MIIKYDNTIIDTGDGTLGTTYDSISKTYAIEVRNNMKTHVIYRDKEKAKVDGVFAKLLSKITIDADITQIDNELYPETTLTVDPKTVSVVEGAEQVLTINTNASDFSIESDNPAIATVNKGAKKIVGVKAGKCNVTIKATKEHSVEKVEVVSVTVIPETTLSVTPNPVTLTVGGKQVLTITTNASDFTIESDATGVATVDKTRKEITAVSDGSANVTVKATAQGANQKSVTIPVTVNPAPQADEPITADDVTVDVPKSPKRKASVNKKSDA